MAVLPFVSCIVCLTFAFLIFRRFSYRKAPHLLLWGIGMVFYAIGGFCEAYYTAFGWNPLIFRLWYLFGAILVAAWLGQGTVYLLIRKPYWANGLMTLLVLGSLYSLWRVFTAQLDPAQLTSSLHTGSVLSGIAIVSPGVRTLTPFFNIYGTLTLVGGAIWSAWTFWQKHILPHRAVGNLLIAAGALLPAFGGSFSRFGFAGALYLSELLGAVLLFIGFIRATTPLKATKEIKP
jgi:hypothetical protein